MKQLVFITVIITFTILTVFVSQSTVNGQQSTKQKQYTSRFDNVDVDKILKNDRILNNYIKCLLEKGPCTQEGRELKTMFYFMSCHENRSSLIFWSKTDFIRSNWWNTKGIPGSGHGYRKIGIFISKNLILMLIYMIALDSWIRSK
uniref:CSON007979 protein n=1 Tax=Culicoides sonorensis TaxID=179676 RepID=A0A336LYC3_CULSO